MQSAFEELANELTVVHRDIVRQVNRLTGQALSSQTGWNRGSLGALIEEQRPFADSWIRFLYKYDEE